MIDGRIWRVNVIRLWRTQNACRSDQNNCECRTNRLRQRENSNEQSHICTVQLTCFLPHSPHPHPHPHITNPHHSTPPPLITTTNRLHLLHLHLGPIPPRSKR